MIKFQLKILGNNAAIPSLNRATSSQILNINEELFLIDCGEGTQIQLMKYKIKINKIKCIFISHLHGDHYFGVIGLLSSLNLNKRKCPLYLYGPPGLIDIISINFKYSKTNLKYPLLFYPIDDNNKVIFENDNVIIKTIPLKHNILCNGFLFIEKINIKNIKIDQIKKYNISINEIKNIKKGHNLIRNSKLIHNNELTFQKNNIRSYAYCSDTIMCENIKQYIYGVNLLYHESTFMDNMKIKANKTHHSTTIQAGYIAKIAKVNKLIIGHFSSRYRNLNLLLNESRQIFENTHIAIEGNLFNI